MSQPAYRVTAELPEVRLDRVVGSLPEASQAFVDWLESLHYHRSSVHGEVIEVLEITDGHYQAAEEGTLVANVLYNGVILGYDAHGAPRRLYDPGPTYREVLATEPLMVRTQVHLHITRLLASALKAVESHRLEGELIVYDLTHPQLELIRRIAMGEIVRSVFHGTRQHEFSVADSNARTAAARLQARVGVEETHPHQEEEF